MEEFYKKGAFKNFAKITENIYAGVSFLIKIQVGASTLLQRDSSIGVFCKFCEILKTLLLETPVNGWFYE